MIYLLVRRGLVSEINDAWTEAIHLDRRLRLLKVGDDYFYTTEDHIHMPAIISLKPDKNQLKLKDELKKSHSDKIDIENRSIQSTLAVINPVDVITLDSIFQSILYRDHIYAKSEVLYYHDTDNNLPIYSTKDTTFYKSAIPTTVTRTGLDNSIKIQGFVRITSWNCISYGKVFFFLWFIIGVCCNIIPLGIAMYIKKIKCDCSKNQICFYHGERRLSTNKKTVELTPFQSKLFEYLLSAPNHYHDYKSMLNHLWNDDEDDKKKLEQQRRTLQDKLREISSIEIVTIPRSGYQMKIPDGTEILLKP